MRQNYGPRGLLLIQAGFLDLAVGWLLTMLSLVLPSFSGAMGTFSYYIGAFGILVMLFSFVRYAQARRAGLTYRGSNPYLRPRSHKDS